MFDSTVVFDIVRHAKRVYPEESCGYVMDNAYIECENVADNPRTHYRIADSVWGAAYLSGRVQAVVHSHTPADENPTTLANDWPSDEDQAAQLAHGIPHGITTCFNRANVCTPWFWGDGTPIQPYLGREFRHVQADCYCLIRDWYRQERKIVLPNRIRKENWWASPDTPEGLLIEWYRQDGWVEIEIDEAKTGDVFLVHLPNQSVKVACHTALYLGNGKVLHHLPRRLSRTDPAAPYRKLVDKVLRWSGK